MTRPNLRRSRLGLGLLVLVQLGCAFVFSYDILTAFFLLPAHPLSWELREVVDVAAALGLIGGSLLGTHTLLRLVEERNRAERARVIAEDRLRRASTEFRKLLDERFAAWDFTPAERDVAMFALKGLSLSEIALLRATTEGTVKTQTNAIYRKAGVTGRPQFLSLFIEDLLMDDAPPVATGAETADHPVETGRHRSQTGGETACPGGMA